MAHIAFGALYPLMGLFLILTTARVVPAPRFGFDGSSSTPATAPTRVELMPIPVPQPASQPASGRAPTAMPRVVPPSPAPAAPIRAELGPVSP